MFSKKPHNTKDHIHKSLPVDILIFKYSLSPMLFVTQKLANFIAPAHKLQVINTTD